MSKADEIRANAGKVRKLHATPQEDRVPTSAPTVRTQRVRRTVDLSPHRHRELTAWCTDAAADLGLARLTGQDVLSALVGRLLTDELLARKIREDIRADSQ